METAAREKCPNREDELKNTINELLSFELFFAIKIMMRRINAMRINADNAITYNFLFL